MRRPPASLLSLLFLVSLLSAPAAACDGDCSGDDLVTVDEIVRGVSIALGQAEVGSCPPFDRGGDGQVTVDEIIAAVAAALNGCPDDPLPRLRFTDVTQAAGLLHEHVAVEVIDHLTGGAAAGDFDGDGWVDLFVTGLAAPDRLYRNRGDGTFVDVTSVARLNVPARRSNGAAWGDIDNDGDLDLFVTTLGADQRRFLLFINDGEGRFTEEGQARGAAVASEAPHFGFSVSFGDYDLDGYLDLHTTEFREQVGATNPPSHARLLRNRGVSGPGTFEDVTEAAGVSYDVIPDNSSKVNGTFSLASVFADLNEDDWPDLIVSGWYGMSRAFISDGNGTFVGGEAILAESDVSGLVVADLNGDRSFDAFLSGIYDPRGVCDLPGTGCTWGGSGNRFLANRGAQTVDDVTDAYGVRDGGMGMGAAAVDFDNDGDLDVVQTNGLRLPVPAFEPLLRPFLNDPLRLWRNDGDRWVDVAAEAGLTSTESGKGLLTFDYDRDGDVDVFVVNNDGRPQLFRNDGGNTSGWLRLELEGTRTNRSAIGAIVRWRQEPGGPMHRLEVGGHHFLGQSETTLHLGLGEGGRAPAEVQVYWPLSKALVTLPEVPRNTTLRVVEPES